MTMNTPKTADASASTWNPYADWQEWKDWEKWLDARNPSYWFHYNIANGSDQSIHVRVTKGQCAPGERVDDYDLALLQDLMDRSSLALQELLARPQVHTNPMLSIAVKGTYAAPLQWESYANGKEELDHDPNHETQVTFDGENLGEMKGDVGKLVSAIRAALTQKTSAKPAHADTIPDSSAQVLMLAADDGSRPNAAPNDAAACGPLPVTISPSTVTSSPE